MQQIVRNLIIYVFAAMVWISPASAESLETCKDSFEQCATLAGQGNAAAKDILGLMYANGDGVSANDATAYGWVNISAAQGNKIAVD